MPKIKNVAMLTVAVSIVQILLTKYLYPVIGKSTQQLYAIDFNSLQPVSGINGKVVGDNLLGYLSGYIPFDITNISVLLAMFIGTFALIWLGFFIYEMDWAWKGRNETQRLVAILLYGHVILGIVLFLLKWGTIPSIGLNLVIGLALNLLLVSTVVALSARKLKFPRV